MFRVSRVRSSSKNSARQPTDRAHPTLTPVPSPAERERGAEGGVRASWPRACALGYSIPPLTGLWETVAHGKDFLNGPLNQVTNFGLPFSKLRPKNWKSPGSQCGGWPLGTRRRRRRRPASLTGRRAVTRSHRRASRGSRYSGRCERKR